MNWKKTLTFCLSATQLLSSWAWAVPALDRDHYEATPVCGLNTQAASERAAKLQAVPGVWAAAPISATTYKILVIRVDFSDKPLTLSKASTAAIFDRFVSFYRENSYGQLTLQYTLSDGGGSQGAYRMPASHAYYAAGINSKYSEMVTDAVNLANTAGTDFTLYDHIMIYHAGQGAETASGSANSYIWSVYVNGSNAGVAGGGANTIDGKRFDGATFVPDSEFRGVDQLGVICHEYGHQLGLPDLYKNSSQTAVGYWDLMDAGIYTGNPQGSSPAHLGAWSKLFLGFSAPETVSVANSLVKKIAKANTNRTAFIRLPIGSSSVGAEKEYFLLEYRSTSGATYDTALPGNGLIIWHIDDSIASSADRLSANSINSDSTHRGVDVVEADTTDPSLDYGDSGDVWTSGAFEGSKTNAYNSSDSGVQIANISGSGQSEMTLSIGNVFNNPALNTDSGSTAVVGGEKGYVNAKGNESLSFSAKPKANDQITATVYTLSGKRVWQETFTGTANQASQRTWNGRNEDGRLVASGVYVLYVSGGGINSVKKFAILNAESSK